MVDAVECDRRIVGCFADYERSLEDELGVQREAGGGDAIGTGIAGECGVDIGFEVLGVPTSVGGVVGPSFF